MSNIESALLHFLTRNMQEHLVLEKNGTLSCRPLSLMERIGKTFGFGNASSTAVMKYILKNEADLHKLSKYYKKNGKIDKVDTLQRALNIYFENAGNQKSAPDLFYYLNQNWMKDLPASAKARKMHEFIIPGTHDSAAYKLNLSKTPEGPWRRLANLIRLGKFLGLRKFVEDFTLTQNYSIEQQLEIGARYFDFRVCYNETDKTYYLSHSFACIRLEDALQQIQKFMREHDHEVIILQIEADERYRNNFTAKHTDGLLKLMDSYLSDILVRPKPGEDNSIHQFGERKYSDLIKKNQRVVLGFPGSHKIAQCSPRLERSLKSIWWQSDLNNTGWLNCNLSSSGIEKVKEKINASYANKHQMNSIALSLTPLEQEIKNTAMRNYLPFLRMFGNFKKKSPTVIQRGREMNQLTTNKFSNNYHGIVYCDSPDHGSTFERLIKLNYEKPSKR